MNRSRSVLGALAGALILSGCTAVPASEPSPAATASASPQASASPSGDATSASPQATQTSAGSPATTSGSPTKTAEDTTNLDDATLSPAGLGPVLIGMSLAEARAHGWAGQNPECANSWDANGELRAEGVQFQFGEDRLQWILISGSSLFTTSEGARLGMSREELSGIYEQRLRTEVRETSGGDVTFPLVQDGDHELIFMFDDSGQLKSALAQPVGAPVVSGC
jgi:hypothetical protein